uniref:Nuclear receptor domain-containing protein n=1 Tax=Globodera rostochiensis TaxID=31243 RepID=A0A914HY15_GLORO
MEISAQNDTMLEVKLAIQMELNFVNRVLLGQDTNLKAIGAMLQLNSPLPSHNGLKCDAEAAAKKNLESKMDHKTAAPSEMPHNSVGRPKRHMTNCKVCGKSSLYCYYGVKCCESCKQFFRRVVVKRTLFNCLGRKCCRIVENASKCRGCRLDKCLLMGMNPTLINVVQSDEFEQFITKLELRKQNAAVKMNSFLMHSSSETFFGQ